VNSPASIIRTARWQAGLSQAQLATRLGVSQAAVARLESPRSNPTVRTLDNALKALGRRLVLETQAQRGIDETLVFEQLKLEPAQRLTRLEDMYVWGRELTLAGARARGELD
jgi:transcriptional regulator with XRE-family HTH domain